MPRRKTLPQITGVLSVAESEDAFNKQGQEDKASDAEVLREKERHAHLLRLAEQGKHQGHAQEAEAEIEDGG
jgi:hypothetical protein